MHVTVTIKNSWDWTDREFNKKLFSANYMGGNGGHDQKGGALVNGPFSLDAGWAANLVLHRPSWFVRGDNDTTKIDPETHRWAIQPSLGPSILRYMGDFEDLATSADIIEFTKRKSAFGPERLVLRGDLISVDPDGPRTAAGHASNGTSLPRGTFHVGDTLPFDAVPRLQWLVSSLSGVKTTGDLDRGFRK
jgi:hypothetical protein